MVVVWLAVFMTTEMYDSISDQAGRAKESGRIRVMGCPERPNSTPWLPDLLFRARGTDKGTCERNQRAILSRGRRRDARADMICSRRTRQPPEAGSRRARISSRVTLDRPRLMM